MSLRHILDFLIFWTRPSSYLIGIGFTATTWAKITVLQSLNSTDANIVNLVAILAADLAVFGLLGGLFPAVERIRPRLVFATLPLAILASTIAIINALYLEMTGAQISVSAISLGLERFFDAWHIAASEHRGWMPVVAGSLVIVAPCLIRWRISRTDAKNSQLNSKWPQRTALAGLVGLLAWLVVVVWLARPATMEGRQLTRNALLQVYTGWIRQPSVPSPNTSDPLNIQRWQLVAPEDIADAATRDHPNVLKIVLESTRLDHIELPGAPWTSPARTPTIKALASRGIWIEGVRAVIPHTSKSLFAMECGRIPLMLPYLSELAPHIQPTCLAETLRRIGYDTAFFQSAVGVFEQRPALVALFGYAAFSAWEQIGGEPLGYLASDDRSMAPAFGEWLRARDSDAPFYATLLTSATHHSYQVPSTLSSRNTEESGDDKIRADYRTLVELEDELIADLLEVLRARDLLSNTLVVVVGDHGEGLPGDRIRQHDNNFLEDGLLVPFVMAGPGVSPNARIKRDVSMVGLAPTVLARLGIPSDLPSDDIRYGVDFLSEEASGRLSIFGCYYEGSCFGFLNDQMKVVRQSSTGAFFAFDLSLDPGEQRPIDPTPAMRETLERIKQIASPPGDGAAPRFVVSGQVFDDWTCSPDAFCWHPNTPKQGFHFRASVRGDLGLFLFGSPTTPTTLTAP